MSVLVSWLVTNRVILVCPHDEFTVDDLIDATKRVRALIQQGVAEGEKQIHVFVDASRVQKQINPLQARGALPMYKEPGLGYVVSGGSGNPSVIFFVRFVAKTIDLPIEIYETPEYALHYLMMKDNTLPDLQAAYRDTRKTLP